MEDGFKTCTKCGEVKPLSEFHVNRRAPDGHAYYCKKCSTRLRQEWRENNRERDYKAVLAWRANNPKKFARIRSRAYTKHRDAVIEKACAYQKTEAGKLTMARAQAKWRAKNPEKTKAHNLLSAAVKDGRVIKPATCAHCNEEFEPQLLCGHHDDYDSPLDVLWLCHKCHSAHHRALRETEALLS